ncbi:hypothetical protein SAMN02910358_01557 [Lachnospiraceae bacterium XBB1006]|nr:hypothetical protein SAMN02910358_01557 [Lachnospiraceae bacterium XBB1006]
MHRNKKRIMLIFIVIAVVSGTICFWCYQQVPNDLSEMAKNVAENKLEFKSKRSFGNDRLDVYSFSLEKMSKDMKFKDLDEKFKDKYENLIDMMKIDADEKKEDVAGLCKQIAKLTETDGTKYMYVRYGEIGQMSKLYIYNASINKGYLLILEI